MGKLWRLQNDLRLHILFRYATLLMKLRLLIYFLGEVEAKSRKMTSVELQDLFVVSEDFLADCKKLTSRTPLLPLLEKHSLASWGKEVIC